jgi:hypothetical protein
MKTLLMYERLIPVNRDQHRAMRIQTGSGQLSFARQTNSLPLAVTELPLAALDYPCVLVGEGSSHALVALVGLRDEENLLVDAQGAWAAQSYVPAFVRRYPFMLAEQDGSDEMTVCVDDAYDGLNTAQGEALFDEQGQAAPYLQQLQNFLLAYHQDMLATARFAQRLADLDLLVERSIDCQLQGQAQRVTLNGFKVVDENRLRALPTDTVQELFASGALGWIHAHLMSLNNVNKLGARLDQRLAQAAALPATAPLTH